MKFNLKFATAVIAAILVVAFALYIVMRPTAPFGVVETDAISPKVIPASLDTSPKDQSAKTSVEVRSSQATFAMGCFWHSEEMFSEIKGVTSSVPGYSGGTEKNPTYDLVSTGSTGYAETVNITFDPAEISYEKLLEVFFAEHDPTTPNYSDPDEGPQYRSVIFYRTPDQQQQAQAYIAKLTSEHKYKNPIVTQVVPFQKFYRAEEYHIHYVRNHPDEPYVAHVTKPEIARFQHDFPELVRRG